MRIMFGLTVGLTGLVAATAASAVTTTLDFAGNICGVAGNLACADGSQIGQGYGDSAIVDVSYRSIATATNTVYEPFLKHWGPNYGDLANVVYGGADGVNYASEIRFTPVAGYEVALIGLDAACYLNRASCRTVSYQVGSVGGTPIVSGSTPLPVGGHAAIAGSSAYFTDGIVLRWGPDAYDAGFDNIAFDVRAVGAAGPVPEPSTWLMMIAGFGLAGAALRRRPATRPAAA